VPCASGREHECDEQDRPELSGGSRGQQVGAKPGVQLARIGENGEQGPIAVVESAEPTNTSERITPSAASTPLIV
jgi:hypothetical protein